MEKHIGDKVDRELFGELMKFVGGILISFVILDFLKEVTSEIIWFANPLILGGLGFIVYNLGVCEKCITNKKQSLL
jgi:hypothetical protein